MLRTFFCRCSLACSCHQQFYANEAKVNETKQCWSVAKFLAGYRCYKVVPVLFAVHYPNFPPDCRFKASIYVVRVPTTAALCVMPCVILDADLMQYHNPPISGYS